MKIAIIGSGIAGNAAAWALNSVHDVTLFETRNRPGGHASTQTIDYDGTALDVDTGFIVYNEPNYPDLVGLFDHLDIETTASNMSFSVSMAGAQKASGRKTAKRSEWNLSDYTAIAASSPQFLKSSFRTLIREIFRFSKQSMVDLDAGNLRGLTPEQYCRSYHPALAADFLLPMGAAIWSTPGGDFRQFPAENFVRFFANHKILDWASPTWRTVKGGSRTYVNKMMSTLVGRIELASKVTSIRRDGAQSHLRIDGVEEERSFDHVIFACHSDQALEILGAEATAQEREVLEAVPYKSNTVYLHRDRSLMPANRMKWAAWNYMDLSPDGEHERDICVSYWMNRLQNIDKSKPVFVTLNPPRAPAAHLTFNQYVYDHPVFDAGSMEAQKTLASFQGNQHTWFCGAWTGYGFHEDGLRSGLDVAEQLGAYIPWRDHGGSLGMIDAAE
jgi:hypothetical protein